MKELEMIMRAESLANSTWVGVLIIFMIVALLIAVAKHRKQYTELLRNILKSKERVVNYDDEQTSFWANLLLWIVVVLSYSLFALSLLANYQQATPPTYYFFIIIGTIALYLLLKYFIIWAFGFTFKAKMQTSTYTTNYFVIISTLGLALLPISTTLIYATASLGLTAIISASILIIAALILITLKLIQIFFKKIDSLLYIFLYLCTLEIVPILMMIKLAITLTNNV